MMRTGSAAAALAMGAVIALFATMAPVRAGPAVEWAAMPLVDLEGEPVDGEDFAGRVVLLVNTASRCAFTPQYEDLEALWDRYEALGLTVLGVPSNDFGRQEPGSNAEIADFCAATYAVSFPILAKSPVTGAAAHPLFAWAREAGGRPAVPAWNFHKILIGRDGSFVTAFPSYVKPSSSDVVQHVERALGTPAI